MKTQELRDRWISDTEESITDRAIEKSSAKVLPENTLLLAMYGATVGQLGMLRRPMTCNQACCAMLVDETQADPRFLFYQLLIHRSQLKRLATGAAQQNLSGQRVKEFRLPFPALSEQRAIAHILGSLDDKVDLNRRMNETLEALARAIFKSWFVNFDPVRAKMEDRKPVGMDAETAALFPDRMQESKIGQIPEGWNARGVGELFELVMGQSPPGETYNEVGDGLPFYQGRTDFGFRFPTRRVYCNAPTRLARKGDVLVSVRAPVGDVNVSLEQCAIGRGVAAIRHPAGLASYSLAVMNALRDQFGQFEAEGTVFGAINKAQFEGLRFAGAPEELSCAFDTVVRPYDDRIEANEAESVTLAALRDTLLPKLLSGELRIPDAAKLVEAAT